MVIIFDYVKEQRQLCLPLNDPLRFQNVDQHLRKQNGNAFLCLAHNSLLSNVKVKMIVARLAQLVE